MNVITKLMYSIHRILGTLLCILFLMWFLSAFVMMYHRFPRVSAKEKMQKLEMLSQAGDSLPDISSVTARLPRGVKVRSTILKPNAGPPEFSFSTTKAELGVSGIEVQYRRPDLYATAQADCDGGDVRK